MERGEYKNLQWLILAEMNKNENNNNFCQERLEQKILEVPFNLVFCDSVIINFMKCTPKLAKSADMLFMAFIQIHAISLKAAVRKKK